MSEPIWKRMRTEQRRKAELTPEQKVEEFFVAKTEMLALDHFGTEEFDPIAAEQKDPDTIEELKWHIFWEVTDKLDDTINRAETSIAAHNTLVFGERLLTNECLEVPERLQAYLEGEPKPRKKGRGRPQQTDARREHYLELILYTRDTLKLHATRNEATIGVVSACDYIETLAKKNGFPLGYGFSNLSKIWEDRNKPH